MSTILKEELVRAICAEIGTDMIPLGPGSKEKKALFEAVIARLHLPLPDDSKPGLARRIVEYGRENWDSSCESTGDTVTATGLERVLMAIRNIRRDRATLASSETAPEELGNPYLESSAQVDAPPSVLAIDWKALDASTRAHAKLQNAIANIVRSTGLEPLGPAPRDPAFDIGWWFADRFAVCEVKSTTAENAVQQVRLGLGQLLEYRFILQDRLGTPVQAILVVERAHSEIAAGTCGSAGVMLAEADSLEHDLEPVLTSHE